MFSYEKVVILLLLTITMYMASYVTTQIDIRYIAILRNITRTQLEDH